VAYIEIMLVLDSHMFRKLIYKQIYVTYTCHDTLIFVIIRGCWVFILGRGNVRTMDTVTTRIITIIHNFQHYVTHVVGVIISFFFWFWLGKYCRRNRRPSCSLHEDVLSNGIFICKLRNSIIYSINQIKIHKVLHFFVFFNYMTYIFMI
jgi:hypothetical protein